MTQPRARRSQRARSSQEAGSKLEKTASGIRGLDEITGGGLPTGRPTLVCGGAGCGKTLFALEFLIRGAAEYGEPGVFMSFEETEDELAANVASLGFDLGRLVAEGKLVVDHVRVEREHIEETGEYDLEGLFVRLSLAVDQIGARRVALDTIESLFSSLPNEGILRAELRRLFRWIKDRQLTAVVTGEKGDGTLTRQGLEEYVSDCVIFLDRRVIEQVSTRRLRVVKYRGSTHGTNEYPFLIDEHGFSVLPITSLALNHKALGERLSTGVPRLDEMLGGEGYFKASSILVSGTAGTGKTSLAALLARSACEKGARVLFFAFEESADQLIRNMRSIGIELQPYVRGGALQIVASRPHSHGLEMHLLSIHKAVEAFKPSIVVLDPVTDMISVGTMSETHSMLTRLIDFLKSGGITMLSTSLTAGGSNPEKTEVKISSLIDTWIALEMVRSGGERNRTLTIVKSRGMAHSNQTSEYTFDRTGMRLLDTYLGPTGVLTGSARAQQETVDKLTEQQQAHELERTQSLRERRRRAFDQRLKAMQEEFDAEDAELQSAMEAGRERAERAASDRTHMAQSRWAFAQQSRPGRNKRGTQ